MKTIIFFLALFISIWFFITFIVDCIEYIHKFNFRNRTVLVVIYSIIVSALWTYFYYL